MIRTFILYLLGDLCIDRIGSGIYSALMVSPSRFDVGRYYDLYYDESRRDCMVRGMVFGVVESVGLDSIVVCVDRHTALFKYHNAEYFHNRVDDLNSDVRVVAAGNLVQVIYRHARVVIPIAHIRKVF